MLLMCLTAKYLQIIYAFNSTLNRSTQAAIDSLGQEQGSLESSH